MDIPWKSTSCFLLHSCLSDTALPQVLIRGKPDSISLMQHAAISVNMDKDDPALKVIRRDEITVPNVYNIPIN